MRHHEVKVYPSSARLAREEQLAWKLAAYATSRPPIVDDVAEMVRCRIVDNAAVALASLRRAPVAAARAMALAHPRIGGATLFGVPATTTVHAEWAAWANGTAVRELDFHDTFLATEFGHPGDNIAAQIATAQQMRRDGADLVRAVAVAYEVHIGLMKGINLHHHKKDHVGHLVVGTTAGIGALLGLPAAIVYQAINQAVHLGFSTRQSRKGEISSWKAFVPGFSGKLAIEAVDRAMRGEAAPSPIYEGEDSVIAWMLDGPEAVYEVPLQAPGEAPRQILETYTKAHAAEYQAQALIDLALEMREEIGDPAAIERVTIRTSHHTHTVIGTGANDPQKFDPGASRETLDHSIMYIFAVALEDGAWHHVDSYLPERAARPSTVALWRRIETVEDPDWTARYHDPDPGRRAFGGRVEVEMTDGRTIAAEKLVADAHPNGAHPWDWNDYAGKFDRLAGPVIGDCERDRFLDSCARLARLDADAVRLLNPVAEATDFIATDPTGTGIFDHGAPRSRSVDPGFPP